MSDDSKHRGQEFARIAFHEYLLRQAKRESIQWEAVAPDPPDYFLTLDGTRFAVEVTAMMEKMTIAGKPRSTVGISASLFKFVHEVENDARDSGILRGAYVLSVDVLDELGTRWADLKRSVLDYVNRTRDLESAPEKVLLENRPESWWIAKFGSHKNYIGGLVGGGGKWEGEANQDIHDLLAEAVATKSKKLSLVPEPAILLLLDAYHFADTAGWRQAVTDDVRNSRFCAIIRIRDNGSCQLLSYQEPWHSIESTTSAG